MPHMTDDCRYQENRMHILGRAGGAHGGGVREVTSEVVYIQQRW